MLPKTQYGFFMLFFIPINRKKSILVGPEACLEAGTWRREARRGRCVAAYCKNPFKGLQLQ